MSLKEKDGDFNSNRRDFLKAAGIGAAALTLQGFVGTADAATELSHKQKVLSEYKQSDITKIANQVDLENKCRGRIPIYKADY